jgi:signal transduction histidine kinase/CheY-like chemotaxis protein
LRDKVRKKRIKNRELTAMITAVFMSFALVLVAAVGLSQTNEVITQLESKSLPDIRVGLGLAEGVAQVAAFAPYVASINQPSLLEDQNNRLANKFNQLFNITKGISDDDVRESLSSKLKSIQTSTTLLSSVIRQNIFLSEELLSRRYQLKFSTKSSLEESLAGSVSEPQKLNLLIQLLTNAEDSTLNLIDQIANNINLNHSLAHSELKKYIEFAQKNISKTLDNNRRKQFLLVSIRIQSEYLSNYVNDYVNSIQDQVYDQQKQAQTLISQVFWGMVAMMILLIVAVTTNYGINVKVAKDLSTVTDDMIRLSIGDTKKLSRIKPRNDEIGELLNAYQVFRDYTYKIQKASASIEEQKLLLESIFDGMYDGLSVYSKENRLLAWNKQYLSTLGLQEEDVQLGMPLEQILNKISNNGEIFKDIDGNAINFSDWSSIRHRQELCIERHDKFGGIIEFRSKPMGNGGFITLTQDLTYRRETELQLQQAVKMEGLGQLTGGVSHDFNNFLTTILGNLQLLEMQNELGSNSKKYVTRALKATENGRELVKKLLAFSRKQILEPEIICVETLIQETQDLLEYSLDEGVELQLALSPSLHHIKIDRIQLQNVLLNLTINSNGAISDTGTITIITEEIKRDNQSWLMLSVADNGKGIPIAIQHRVFEAFFTTKEVGVGSGLGLSSVHGYVIQSGGKIGIQSEPNHGTTIWMQWPIEHIEHIEHIHGDDTPLLSHQEPLPLPPPAATNEALVPSNKGILLLLEDDEQVAQTMIDVLSGDVAQVVHFSRANHALDWLNNNHIHVSSILSDVHLAHSISGVEFKATVNSEYPAIPVFLYSGMSKEMIEQQFNCQLDNQFLNKPVTYDAINRLVKQMKN